MWVVKSRTKFMTFRNEDAAKAVYRELKKDRRFKGLLVYNDFMSDIMEKRGIFDPDSGYYKLNRLMGIGKKITFSW
jgi:hypothetical protein